jgi:hypothetical protein
MRKILARLAFALVLMPSITVAARPIETQRQVSWDGMWVGNWTGGSGVQLVFVRNEALAFYWRGDYVEGLHSSLARGGTTVAIIWPAGSATLTRDREETAHIVVREKGRADIAFALKRDN